MDKKGSSSIAIVLFVFIVLGLFGATLFVLNQNLGKTIANLESGRFVEEAYAKEAEIEYFAKVAGENVLKEIRDSNSGDESEMRDIILAEFPSKFQAKLTDMRRDNIPLKNFAERVEKGEFELTYDGNYVFRMNEFVIIGDLVDSDSGREWIWRETPEDYTSSDEKFVAGIIYRTNITAVLV